MLRKPKDCLLNMGVSNQWGGTPRHHPFWFRIFPHKLHPWIVLPPWPWKPPYSLLMSSICLYRFPVRLHGENTKKNWPCPSGKIHNNYHIHSISMQNVQTNHHHPHQLPCCVCIYIYYILYTRIVRYIWLNCNTSSTQKLTASVGQLSFSSRSLLRMRFISCSSPWTKTCPAAGLSR